MSAIWVSSSRNGFSRKCFTFPEAFSNAATISKTDVPFPVPKLYTSQPVDSIRYHVKVICSFKDSDIKRLNS